jgi:Mn2+/Fe2+ NRAMP family transporter
MLSRVLNYFLSASVVFGTAVLAAPANSSSVETYASQAVSADAAGGGYKNAAYFVNWYVPS